MYLKIMKIKLVYKFIMDRIIIIIPHPIVKIKIYLNVATVTENTLYLKKNKHSIINN